VYNSFDVNCLDDPDIDTAWMWLGITDGRCRTLEFCWSFSCGDSRHGTCRDSDIKPFTDGGVEGERCVRCSYERITSTNQPLYGDVDGDGKIDAADITLLRRYIAANDKPAFLLANPRFNLENARVTGHSGDPNAADVARLRQYVAGFDVELGK